MKKKNHKILDHPIWGYFLLAAFGFVLMGLGSMGDSAINVHILHLPPGNTAKVGSGIATAAAALVAAGLFKLWFRPDFKGSIQIKGLLTGILMLLPVMIVHYAGSIVSWATFGTGSVLLALLQCFAPGFGEEIVFRGMGVANYMRTIKSEKQILVIFWLSSVVFGLAHGSNVLSGGDPFACSIQSIYAIGAGMALGAVYLRTGNLLPCILAHMSIDFLEFIRGDLSQSGGLMAGDLGTGDWITVAAGAIAAICGWLLVRPKYRASIMEIWNDKWNEGYLTLFLSPPNKRLSSRGPS